MHLQVIVGTQGRSCDVKCFGNNLLNALGVMLLKKTNAFEEVSKERKTWAFPIRLLAI